MESSSLGERFEHGCAIDAVDQLVEPSDLPRPLTNMMPEPALVSSGSRRAIFTPTAINAIRVMAAQGKSAAEIAAQLARRPRASA